MGLTKKDIAKEIANSNDFSLKESNLFLEKFISILKDNIKHKKDIKISGFGTLRLAKTPKRIGRNPKTKESFVIPQRNRMRLIPSKKLKGVLN